MKLKKLEDDFTCNILKFFLTAIVFLGSFSSYFAYSEDCTASSPFLEWRLQRLMTEEGETKRLHHLFNLLT